MSENWIRKCSLVMVDEKGNGLDLSPFKFTFSITWQDTKYSKSAVFKIYNLSSDVTNKITKGEFAQIQLLAGYQDNASLIFSGEISFSIDGRDNATDTFVTIQASENDKAFCYATVNTTLAAGYSKKDVFQALLKSVRNFGVTVGLIPELDDVKMPRGKPLYGMHRDEMDRLASQTNATWQYINNTIQMRPDNTHSTDIIVLNNKTGLIGIPQQTINGGINLQCLINPSIVINSLIRLDNSSTYKTTSPNDDMNVDSAKAAKKQTRAMSAILSKDGDYKVINISYHGDTRGSEWYMDLVCTAKDRAEAIALNKVSSDDY
ncbi:phage protein [Serratia sp. D1N4]